MVTFGRKPTFQSSDEIDFAVSEDGRSFTLEFIGSGFQLDTGSSEAMVSTRLFFVVVPLEGDDERVEIEFIADTSATALNGATAVVVLSVNGQTVAADLAVQDQDQSFDTTLKFAAARPAECRLGLLFLTGRESKNSDSQAILTAHAIDAEILPRPPGPQGPPVGGEA